MVRLFEKIKGPARRKGMAPENLPYSFPFDVIKKATNNFDKEPIGVGGFGEVYMGELKCGTKVAVKRKKMASQQGQKEFRVEIELLTRLKHPNLVALIGYCDEENEMILVYEYMKNGTLTSHLYGSDKPSLKWPGRLEACVGAARGLHYLHTSSAKGIIHRDVKSENILLGENLCAKVGDFGLSKDGPDLNQTHVSTNVKGTFGYVDPEYHKTKQLTQKSDVYSFGVVLLEALCGKPVVDLNNPSAEKVSLVCWGKKMLAEGRVEEIADRKILRTNHPHNLAMFGDIVLRCLAEERENRPTMEQVLEDLEQELEYVRAMPANPDESVLGSIRVAAGDSGESSSGHAVVSSQRIRQEKKVKALKRSEGKTYERSSSVSHDPSTESTSRVARLSRSPVLGGDAMKMKGRLVELESISEDEDSQ